MNTITIVIVSVVILILLLLLVMAILTIYDLERAKANLKDDNSKLADALRRKGIEVDGLKKKVKRIKKEE